VKSISDHRRQVWLREEKQFERAIDLKCKSVFTPSADYKLKESILEGKISQVDEY